MPRRITVADLVTLGKQKADQENSTFLADADWKGHLSAAYAELYEEIVKSGLRYFEREHDLTTEYTDLPDDHLSTIGVDYVLDTAGRRRQLYELMAQERDLYAGVGSGIPVAYTIEAQKLRLHPAPAAGVTCKHVYLPQPVRLVGAADALELDVIMPLGEQFVSWSMAFQALAKEESDVTVAAAER